MTTPIPRTKREAGRSHAGEGGDPCPEAPQLEHQAHGVSDRQRAVRVNEQGPHHGDQDGRAEANQPSQGALAVLKPQ